MATVWAVLFSGVHYARRRNARSAVVVGVAVLSHWVLDFIVHRPDLQLYPGGGVRVGLGVWKSVPASLALEALFFGSGEIGKMFVFHRHPTNNPRIIINFSIGEVSHESTILNWGYERSLKL
jgi:hypothetical protein